MLTISLKAILVTTNIEIDISNEDNLYAPDKNKLLECLEVVTTHHKISDAVVNVSIASNDEIQCINEQFRDKNKPTNIISFEFEKPDGLPDDVMDNFLGDIVIAPYVLESEAIEQHKTLQDHWCHIFIHGLLHLLGYDHIDDDEANIMETLEIELLNKLQISNPYTLQENLND